VWLVVAVDGVVTVTYNAALRRASYQSSVYIDSDGRYHSAALANDGDRSTQSARCATTRRENNPWWAVDLGVPSTVARVDLVSADHNNGRLCQPRV